ncbi:Uncharacterised protein [Mycobacteroides abscessus subsp. abscessus]|nr:Uncharacterised protein [Mycobacteroides abscessus subsp. abscessus]SKW37719.1 Uncharacterised protein [Mycobacteroides abscessus subsp. abscessus]
MAASRSRAASSRASAGTLWLTARRASWRSGSVYWTPVSPVRASTVSAAVSPHTRRTSSPRP